VLGLSATDVAELSRSLQVVDAREVAMVDLLDAARSALDAGRLDEGEDGAVALYRRILTSDPGNAVALAGLRDVLDQLLAQAAGRRRRGEDGAVALARRILTSDPGNAVALAGLRDVLDQLLAQAAGRIAAGEPDAGSSLIERVAALDPSHLGLPEARARLAAA